MKHTKILLIDCNPHENIGELLESILASSPLEGTLRREIIADLDQLNSDWNWLNHDSLHESGLIFIILPNRKSSHDAALIQSLNLQRPEIPIIVVIKDCGPGETLELLRNGASDFVTPPLRSADILARTWRLLNRPQARNNVVHATKQEVGLRLLIGKTSSFLAEIKKIPLIARCDSRVLITGETGTGKEMCARAIHYLSPRTAKPFVPVNCGAIPVELAENELFGHESGAFTGANTAKPGLVEEAEGGTLFLDEIDCLPLLAQVKLLRFLQDKQYRRLGSSKMRYAEVRTIVASNAVLEDAVQKGQMRQDLYYRLNVICIALPPLRERREDISLLANHFLQKYAVEFGKDVRTISAEALQRLTFYDWPGNVRELEHTIERAVVFCEDSVLGEEDIALPSQDSEPEESFQQAKAKIIEQFEKDYVQRLLLSCNGNISRAAQAARKNRRAFWELIRKHRINANNFKLRAT
jgi:two-component system, NtrC family, response regulator GlrR